MSEFDELTALEKRLVLEYTSALAAMAKQPGVPFAPVELSRIADIYTVLQAVQSALSAQRPREGFSR